MVQPSLRVRPQRLLADDRTPAVSAPRDARAVARVNQFGRDGRTSPGHCLTMLRATTACRSRRYYLDESNALNGRIRAPADLSPRAMILVPHVRSENRLLSLMPISPAQRGHGSARRPPETYKGRSRDKAAGVIGSSVIVIDGCRQGARACVCREAGVSRPSNHGHPGTGESLESQNSRAWGLVVGPKCRARVARISPRIALAPAHEHQATSAGDLRQARASRLPDGVTPSAADHPPERHSAAGQQGRLDSCARLLMSC